MWRTGAPGIIWIRSKAARWGLFLLIVVGLAGCTRPGEGTEASRAFAAVTPVAEALGAYYGTHDAYPSALADLVPALLAADHLAAATARPGPGLTYRRETDGFVLELRHGGGVGEGRCILRPDSDGWGCVWRPW